VFPSYLWRSPQVWWNQLQHQHWGSKKHPCVMSFS
jgi:hypothetical protein